MSGYELEQKYMCCASMVLPSGVVDQTFYLLRRIDTLNDIRELVDLTCCRRIQMGGKH